MRLPLPSIAPDGLKIPSRYAILNPADIQLSGSLNFSDGKYYKTLTDYEIERLKNPKTDEDLEVYNALNEESKKMLKKKGTSQLLVPLDPKKMSAVFYKRMDYEPFAVPMGYPVL